MGSTQTSLDDSLFDNTLFSDVLIRQTHHGKTKEYHAHKAILSTSSKWFRRALTGKWGEAKSGVIELHDDDPIYFEILLRYLYEHKWNTTIADQKSHGRHKDTFPAKALTPIGVYALADKYGVEELMACAVDRLAHPVTPACDYWFAGRVAYLEQSRNVLEAHYSHCVKSNCPMGRRLCQIVIKYGERSAKDKVIEDLAVKSPALAADMYFAARESGSKIW